MRKLAARAPAFVTLCVSATLLSACAAQEPAAPSLSPTPNELANAIELTAARGTTAITVTIESDTETLTGTGSTSMTSPKGSITWNSSNSNTGIWTELQTRKALYSFIDDTWFAAPPGTFTPTSAALSPLDGLNELVANSDNPFSGTLPLTIESGLNFSEEELVNLPSECPPEISVSIELDTNGGINRITKEFMCPDYDRFSVTELTGFGITVTVTEPTDAIEVPGNQ